MRCPTSTRASAAAGSRAAVLADSDDDDGSRLRWVRADGAAAVEPADGPDVAARDAALDALAERYPQYLARRPGARPARAVERWTGWAYSPSRGQPVASRAQTAPIRVAGSAASASSAASDSATL